MPKRRGVGGLALHADGGIVASGRDLVHVRDGETATVFTIEGLPGWNDLCTDRAGRVYARRTALRGVRPRCRAGAGRAAGASTRRGTATRLYGDVVHANGIALSPDEDTIYHSDTRSHAVVVHTLRDDGSATDRRVIDTREYGQPDGLAVDEDGAIWIALLGLRHRPVHTRRTSRSADRGALVDDDERLSPRP